MIGLILSWKCAQSQAGITLHLQKQHQMKSNYVWASFLSLVRSGLVSKKLSKMRDRGDGRSLFSSFGRIRLISHTGPISSYLRFSHRDEWKLVNPGFIKCPRINLVVNCYVCSRAKILNLCWSDQKWAQHYLFT